MQKGLRPLVAALGIAVTMPALAAEPPLYFHRQLVLSSDAPTGDTPRDDGEVSLLRRRSARIATFQSGPAATDVVVGDVITSLFLVTRRVPMDACAEVTVELFRRTLADQRIGVASNTVSTSILRKREATQPITVAMTLNGLLAAAGDRIEVDVVVRNECDSARSVTLLYDSIAEPSGLVFTDLPPGVTTTTTVTTTTVTTTTAPGDDGGDGGGGPTTTSTTLPPGVERPETCLHEPLGGWNLVLCQLDTISAILRAQPVPTLGGTVARKRLFLRLDRARALAAAVAPAGDHPRLVTRAIRSTRRFMHLLHRGMRLGRVHPGLMSEVEGLASAVVGEMKALR